MIDRLFLATLTFCLLIAGTLAIATAMFGPEARIEKTVRLVQLQRVIVTAKRPSAVAATERVEPAGQRAQ